MQEMQERDAKNSFDGQESHGNQHIDFKPQAGRSNGLSLILDAHSDKVASSSISTDIDGFFAIVDSGNHYPMTLRKSTLIRPGHDNMVAIKATKVTSDDRIRTAASPEKRQCLFADERQLTLHKKYTQANCFLECSLKSAIQRMNPLDPCVPWFFPDDGLIRMCNPFEAHDFMKHMKSVSDDDCSDCLPDCTGTSYEASVSAGEIIKLRFLKAVQEFSVDPIWG